MSLTQLQKDQFNRLIDHRNEISNALFQIERILKEYFPEEFNIAYQHYIPQIMTAINNDERWLPRGSFNMQQTINRLLDKINSAENDKSVSKYI